MAAPRIVVEPEVLDFGTLNQHESRSGEVMIMNRGDVPLHIEKVETSCGCTAAVPDRDVLSPGESTALSIDFNSKSFQGEQNKTVKIFTNDPDRPESHVIVHASIHVPLQTVPPHPRLGFPKLRQGQTETREFKFYAPDVERLEIELERHDPEKFAIEVVPDYEGDPQRAALRITVPETMPVGKQRDMIRVATNVPEQPTMDIELRANVVEELTVFPERLSMRFLQPDQDVKKYVRVSLLEKDHPFNVTGAEIDIPGLVARVDETVADQEFFVYVEGKALGKDHPQVVKHRGRVSGTLRITTDVKKQPVVEVPVTYMIRL
jgi:hypothetical protein